MQLDLFSQPKRTPPQPANPPQNGTPDKPRREKPKVRNASVKRAEMLERLKAGPLSTFEAERLHHRGQATIGALRDEGHQIELIKIDEVDHYRYCGYEPRIKVTPEMQEAYYFSVHWKEASRQRREIDGYHCQRCKSNQELEVHHWRYELFHENVERDLITFCATCHQDVHECASGSKGMHFPRWVDAETAARLGGV